MSMPITFHPKHPQPFTLQEAMNLEIDMLAAEIKRLENSIKHLQQTQDDLLEFLRSEEGQEEEEEGSDGEIRNAVAENEGVIASQTERIALIRVALLNKLGSDARLEHYGLSAQSTAHTPPASTPSGGGTGNPNPSSTTVPSFHEARPTTATGTGDEDGLHL